MTESSLDPRIHVYRPDLADSSLRVFVKAEKYVDPIIARSVVGVLPVFESPAPGARRVTEIRYGEFINLFEKREDGNAWVQNKTDSSVGYVRSLDALSESIADNAYRLKTLSSFVYAEPDLHAPVLDRLTLGSYLHVGKVEDGFYPLSGGYVFAGHVALAEEVSSLDIVSTAGRLIGVPYLESGRTTMGIDGAGLVQLALDLSGRECPRESDQQAAAFGKPLPKHWRDIAWRRGDLVFFEHHVGIMAGEDHLLHADPFAMQVVSEPLVDVVLRGQTIIGRGRV